MKNNLIQIVGISGCGKSRLLEGYFQKYNPKDMELFEFGKSIRREKSLDNNSHETDHYINKVVDFLISSDKKYLVTSHIVHKSNNGHDTDFQYDKRMDSLAYIHIITNPEDIFMYRKKDNLSNVKMRSEENPKSIALHQDLSLAKTQELTTIIGSDMFIIYNDRLGFEKNLKTMNEIIQKYFHPR
jgi:adenylate kinase